MIETPRSDYIKELAESKEELQKLRSELKMKNLLLEKMEGEVYKTRYDGFKEVEMGEGTRRHDEDLIKVLRRAPHKGLAIPQQTLLPGSTMTASCAALHPMDYVYGGKEFCTILEARGKTP
jgi:hypothetical protein